MNVRSVLSDRWVNPVLIRLYEIGGPVKLSDLMDIVSAYSTLENLMKSLEKEGFIKLTRVTKPYKTNFAELTDLGHRVAKKLAAANDIALGKTPEPETNCSDAPEIGGKVR